MSTDDARPEPLSRPVTEESPDPADPEVRDASTAPPDPDAEPEPDYSRYEQL